MCPHVLSCITGSQSLNAHTQARVYVLAVSPNQPQARMCRHMQTQKHTHLPVLGQTCWHEHMHTHCKK